MSNFLMNNYWYIWPLWQEWPLEWKSKTEMCKHVENLKKHIDSFEFHKHPWLTLCNILVNSYCFGSMRSLREARIQQKQTDPCLQAVKLRSIVNFFFFKHEWKDRMKKGLRANKRALTRNQTHKHSRWMWNWRKPTPICVVEKKKAHKGEGRL